MMRKSTASLHLLATAPRAGTGVPVNVARVVARDDSLVSAIINAVTANPNRPLSPPSRSSSSSSTSTERGSSPSSTTTQPSSQSRSIS
ncbi:hypothetical protein FB451DRAFT_1280791 [Mycena latifolia]|nr:hypothetical protein FB451DRAFT_1280791 [Mycena latifolia]